jgi:hypothetical protein
LLPLPVPHVPVVVSTQLDFSVKNESFDDMKIADYLSFACRTSLYHVLTSSLDFIKLILRLVVIFPVYALTTSTRSVTVFVLSHGNLLIMAIRYATRL